MSDEMPPEFTPVNELEELFLGAATDPTQRPRFYRELLDSEIFFFVFYDEIGVRIQTFQQSEQEVVPIFTSLVRLEEFARGVGLAEYKHEDSSAREILTILDGAHVVLNPGAAYGKTFEPEEVRRMLDGSEMKRIKVLGLADDAALLISQPAQYPHELIEDLKASFAFHDWVKAAYLAQVHQPDKRKWPQLIIGVDGDENYDASEAIEIAEEGLGEDEFLTFIRISDDFISDYMRANVEPFYKRDAPRD